jgi:hypothetical protein
MERRGSDPADAANTLVYSEIPAMEFIENFRKEHLKEFIKISSHRGYYTDESRNYTFYDQRKVIEDVMRRVDFFESRPDIMQKLTEYGYRIDDLYDI